MSSNVLMTMGCSRRQARVAGLEFQYPVVKFVGVGRVQVAKNMNDDGLQFGLRVTAQPQERQ